MPRPAYRAAISVDERYRARVRARTLGALVRRTLASEDVSAPATVGVAITDSDTVRELNRRYRGEDAPTDVLSFSLDGGDEFSAGAVADAELGEVVIAFPVAKRQAREAGHSIDAELAHLLVHGVLHLLGYDHQKPREAKVMRAREDALLGRTAH
jgi:probable rRNA maturation factor